MAWPLQSQICIWVPGVVVEVPGHVQALARTHRVDARPVPDRHHRWWSLRRRGTSTVPCAGTEALMVPLVVDAAPVHRSVRV